MIKSDKLKKIIEYAVERGWNDTIISDRKEWSDTDWRLFAEGSSKFPVLPCIIFLFSHDFAKAVFGEGWVCTGCGQETEEEEGEAGLCEHNYSISGEQESFEYHLQQAVISKDPIDYYYKYVKEK